MSDKSSVMKYRSISCVVRDLTRKSREAPFRCQVMVRELTSDAVDIEKTYNIELASEEEMESLYPEQTPYIAGHAYAAIEALKQHGYIGRIVPAYFGDDTVFIGMDLDQ